MIITADTNVLVRAVVGDDPQQSAMAGAALRQADAIAVPLPVLCELVWVLRRVYAFSSADCVQAIEALLTSRTVVTDRPSVTASLKLLTTGGDFADGVIAFGGRALGAERMATFDRRAAQLLNEAGEPVLLLSS